MQLKIVLLLLFSIFNVNSSLNVPPEDTPENFLGSRYEWGFRAAKLCLSLCAHYKAVLLGHACLTAQEELDEAPPASEITTRFIKEKLAQSGLSTDLPIKVFDFGDVPADFFFMGAFYNKLLGLATQTDTQIQIALATINDLQAPEQAKATAQAFLLSMGFLINHEIKHLKNNDTQRIIAATAGITAALEVADFFVERTLPVFKKPKTHQEAGEQIVPLLHKACIKLFANGLIHRWYRKSIETAADEYALQKETNPQALYASANFLEGLRTANINTLIATTHLPKSYLTLYYEYWLNTEHPSELVRAQKMRAAAQKLENPPQKVTPTFTPVGWQSFYTRLFPGQKSIPCKQVEPATPAQSQKPNIAALMPWNFKKQGCC